MLLLFPCLSSLLPVAAGVPNFLPGSFKLLIVEGSMKKFFLLIWRGWKAVAHALGIVNTKILLTVAYFIIIAIGAGLTRLFGADLLDKRRKKKDSFWSVREPVEVTIESCKRQF